MLTDGAIRWIKASAAVAVVTAISVTAGDARAFCRSTTCTGDGCARDGDDCKITGAKLYWDSQCVSFSVQRDGSEHIPLELIRETVIKGFVEWTNRACPDGGSATMAFSADEDAECHAAEYNQDGANANIILFQDYKWGYTSSDNTLAKTTVTYDTDTGEILDADIEINHAYNEYTVSDETVVIDLQSILTHEIGHFIGLDHTYDFSATMNAGYQEGTMDLRTLESDDIDGLCAAYPPGRDAKCNPTPKGGFSAVCGEEATEEEGGCAMAPRSPSSARRVARGSWPFGAPGAPTWGWFLAACVGLVILRRRRDRLGS
jgi:hypothetical protein